MRKRSYTGPQVADLLGVEPATVRAYNYRGQMPEPTGETEGGWPTWDADEIDAWVPTRRPRKVGGR